MEDRVPAPRRGRAVLLCVLAAWSAALPITAPLPAQETGDPRGDRVRVNWPIDIEAAPRPAAVATRIAARIRVDGRLDEAVWRQAQLMDGFIQSQPMAGYPATERTVVRILFDDQALYIGAVCYDSEPRDLVVRTLERDMPGENTRDSDIFAVSLDTFLDRRNSFLFLVNPLGGYKDMQTFNDSRSIDDGWDAIAEIRTTVADSGWTVEMAIPWSTLRFDPSRGEQRWGMNLLRRVRRKNEDSYWAPLDRRDPLHRMSKAGTLALPAADGYRAGRNLRVKPFALARASPGDVSDVGPLGGTLDAGLDLKLGLTSQLTLDGTLRTEFSQVEVDQEQVNLTQFPIFFPEKREFFVENSGSFTFGDVTERNYRMGTSLRDFTLFHSRRIGLTPGGAPIPIAGGARLTGRAGGFELGLLNMQTERAAEAPAENFAVLRLRRNVSAGSDVGLVFINRQPTGAGGGAYNRSFGADANLRLFGGLIINSYLTGTAGPGRAQDGAAGRVSMAWRDRLWNASAMVKQVGRNFSPRTGFIRRTGIRHGYLTLGAHPRPSLRAVQELNPYAELHYITNLDDVLESRELTLGLGTDFADGGTLAVDVNDRFERLDTPFLVRAGIAVPAGGYDFREASVRYTSNRGRSISGSARLVGGGYFNGDRTTVAANLDWRPSPYVSFRFDASHNDVSLPDTSFSADVYGARIKFASSPRLMASAFVQYNQAAEQVLTNLRLNLVHAPLSDIFLVFTERRSLAERLDPGTRRVLERVLVAKVTRLLAF